MKILFLDPPGLGLSFALNCQQAGHEVIMAVGLDRDGLVDDTGEGLVPRTRNWEAKMRWADLIVMTYSKSWEADLEPYFKKGFPIVGPSIAAARLERDRTYGQKVLNTCGVDTIPFCEFHDYDEAMTYVQKTKARLVSKPFGDKDKSLSYVSKNSDDMLHMLSRWKKQRPCREGFMLQEFTEGIEMAVGGWIWPGGWIGPWTESFEHKKLMSGEIGPNTGEMGSVMKYVKESYLADCVLAPCESILHSINYTGYVDLNCLIDKKGKPWPLEFTTRLGWPLFNLQDRMNLGDPAKWMLDALQGKDTLNVSRDHCTGVILCIPDFPYSHLTKKHTHEIPIYGISKENRDSIHPDQLQAGTGPVDGKWVDMYVTAGDQIVTVTGTGKSVAQATKRAYETVKEIHIPNNMFYRDDIGEKVMENLPKLQKLGYAMEWKVE